MSGPATQTFNDPLPKQSDAERQEQNAIRATKGEPQVGGSAGREHVASKDPQEFDARGGPGSEGNKPVQDPVM